MLRVAIRCWRDNKCANEPGPLRFARGQLRTETLIFAAQLAALFVTLYRVNNPDIPTCITRATIAVLLAVAMAYSRHDFRRL